MTPTTLREFVELWQSIYTCDVKPSVFISQKFKNCEDDKLEVYKGRMALDQNEDGEDWVLFSSYQTIVVRLGMRGRPLPMYEYKRIAPGNTANFQLKPPVKTTFTGIYGPYKTM